MSTAARARWQAAWDALDRCRGPAGFHASDSAGLYPAVFGRDSLWVVLLLLETVPFVGDEDRERIRDAAEWALAPLLAHQAQRRDDRVEAQPGKIFHSRWPVPPDDPKTAGLPLLDGTTYCGFDQTMLFVVAAERFLRAFPGSPQGSLLRERAGQAVRWLLDEAFDARSGLAAYVRRNPANPVHQVWKDSFDSITHGGFDVPPEPVAWVEVQAYAHRALRAAAAMARGSELAGVDPEHLDRLADRLRARAHRALWWDEEACYALAIDGAGEQVRMVTSNAGHALWGGLPDAGHSAAITGRLTRPDMLTAYGIRTLSAQDRFFEATAYHRGTVWPFDNAVIAAGLLAYGEVETARRIGSAVLSALSVFGVPIELYCTDDAAVLVHPVLSPTPDGLLLSRRPPPHAVQAFSAAAQIFFLALTATSHSRGGGM